MQFHSYLGKGQNTLDLLLIHLDMSLFSPHNMVYLHHTRRGTLHVEPAREQI